LADYKTFRLKSSELDSPKKSGSDHSEWRHILDKSLDQNGNPVINLSREDAESASLQIVLEQGP